MTRSEWDRIAAVLDNGFPGHFGEAESATYWLLLGTRPARQVEDAVRRAVDKAMRYRPTPSELVGLMRESTSTVEQRREQWRELYRKRYGQERADELVAVLNFGDGGRELNA